MTRNTPMTREEQTPLTLQDIHAEIKRREVEFQMSSRDFTQAYAADNLPAGITQDEAAEWDFLLQLQQEIEQIEDCFRGKYLTCINPKKEEDDARPNPFDLAA